MLGLLPSECLDSSHLGGLSNVALETRPSAGTAWLLSGAVDLREPTPDLSKGIQRVPVLLWEGEWSVESLA